MENEIDPALRLYVITTVQESSKELIALLDKRLEPISDKLDQLHDDRVQRDALKNWLKTALGFLSGAFVTYLLKQFLS